MKSASGALPTGDLRLAFVAIVALALAVGAIAATTFAPTIPIRLTPGDIDLRPGRPAAPTAPLLSAPPAGTNAIDDRRLPGEATSPATKPAGPGVIGKDPLRADDDPSSAPNLPGKGALKQ